MEKGRWHKLQAEAFAQLRQERQKKILDNLKLLFPKRKQSIDKGVFVKSIDLLAVAKRRDVIDSFVVIDKNNNEYVRCMSLMTVLDHEKNFVKVSETRYVDLESVDIHDYFLNQNPVVGYTLRQYSENNYCGSVTFINIGEIFVFGPKKGKAAPK